MKATIKKGARVFADHIMWVWPDMPHGDVRKVFTIENSNIEGRIICRADNFGLHAPEGRYGNGSLFVKLSDTIEEQK